jgi:hypothetical protein
MLIKTIPSPALAVGYHPRLKLGPRVAPRAMSLAAAATSNVFNGLYMRPNIANGGVVPASTPLCTSPDIWVAGTNAVANFQQALATTNSYAKDCGTDITQGQPNYIYVRGQNGASTVQSTPVQLYALPCKVIQWPGDWGRYALPIDNAADPGSPPPSYQANLSKVAPGTVGVADHPFVWQNPQPPTDGSDHYCLISWFNTAQNPFPDTFTQLDMSQLVTNDLGFGWRNVRMVGGDVPTTQMTTQLAIPQNTPPGSRQYYLIVTPVGFPAGWQLSMSCSQTDAKGSQIGFTRQTIPTQPNYFVGQYIYLEPGFSGQVTFNLYSNGAAPTPGAYISVQAQYITTGPEAKHAVQRNLVDIGMHRALQSAFRGMSSVIPITPAVYLGADNLVVKR